MVGEADIEHRFEYIMVGSDAARGCLGIMSKTQFERQA